MSKTPPSLADLPADLQAFVATQTAQLARKNAEILGLSLSHATAQKRLKDEVASMDASLAAERAALARAIQKEIPSSLTYACNCTGIKNPSYG